MEGVSAGQYRTGVPAGSSTEWWTASLTDRLPEEATYGDALTEGQGTEG